MEVKQIYELVNNVTSEVLGKTGIIAEDLSNVVDTGKEIFDSASIDNYVKSLVNHIGKVIFVNRPYSGNVPSILMDSWEFGSVLEKVSAELPTATENDTWNLENGKSYDTSIFYQPKVSARFFNGKTTFEIPMSFTEKQVKESFSSASQLNGFMSMLYNSVDTAMSAKIDSLIMRTINTMTAKTLASVKDGETSMKAVNLLTLYNNKFGTNLTASEAITNPEFIRFASFTMGLYIDRMSKLSVLFNIGGKERFTPKDSLRIVMLSDFKNACASYLQSDTFHDNYVALPNSESVPYWQGCGTDYSFNTISSINVVNGDTTVSASGIISIMFDKNACAVCNTDKRVTTAYNAKAEFFNNYYKFDASYYVDENENFVVFYVA